MKRAKQLSLIPSSKTNKRFFGGSLLVGCRKGPRPMNTKEPIHLVMRSQYAHGVRSFRSARNLKAIERILEKAAFKYHIKIYRKAIQSNHIHLIIKISSKKSYKAFIAVIAGKIASYSMKQMSYKNFIHYLKGLNELDEIKEFNKFVSKDLIRSAGEEARISQTTEVVYKTPHKGQAFWDFRPFSRILYWGKDYQTACNYLLRNTLEALGFIAYRPRKMIATYQKILKKQFRI